MSLKLNKLLRLAEQYELIITETEEAENKNYFDFISDIYITLRDLQNEFIKIGIRTRNNYIPLPVVLCDTISLYIDEHTFCPMIKHFHYCTMRLKYIKYYNNYIRQSNICQYYIDIAIEAKEIIKDVKRDIYTNKKIIENSIPFLSTTRLLKPYKNRILISSHNISHCVMLYLDIETFTDNYEIYYSQMREYRYAKNFVRERKVLY